jgi:hypothetical protein
VELKEQESMTLTFLDTIIEKLAVGDSDDISGVPDYLLDQRLKEEKEKCVILVNRFLVRIA